MKGLIFFKDSVVPIMVVRDQPTVFPVAQVLSKLKGGKRKIWMFESPNEARLIALRIVYDTLGVEISESFKLSAFIIRRARSIRYGLEVTKGRKICEKCECVMTHERMGHPLCRYHYLSKADAPDCPTCYPPTPIKLPKMIRCRDCNGDGTTPLDKTGGTGPTDCVTCGGSGQVPKKKKKRKR
jgi:hypothetical protein